MLITQDACWGTLSLRCSYKSSDFPGPISGQKQFWAKILHFKKSSSNFQLYFIEYEEEKPAFSLDTNSK